MKHLVQILKWSSLGLALLACGVELAFAKLPFTSTCECLVGDSRQIGGGFVNGVYTKLECYPAGAAITLENEYSTGTGLDMSRDD